MYNMAHQSQVFVFACFFISTTPSSDWLKAAASWLLSWKTKLKWWIGSRRIHFLANIAFWAPGTDVRFRPIADTRPSPDKREFARLVGCDPKAHSGPTSFGAGIFDGLLIGLGSDVVGCSQDLPITIQTIQRICWHSAPQRVRIYHKLRARNERPALAVIYPAAVSCAGCRTMFQSPPFA